MNGHRHSGPDFLGIGAQKSGTTWLHQMLGKHPEIGLPPGKEVHFWDRRWPAEQPDRYDALFAHIPRRLCGEITPAYATLATETIGFIRARYPSLKLLYVLRDPIARAWSHARSIFARDFPEVDSNALPQHREWFIAHFRSTGSLARGDYAACLDKWESHYPRDQIGLFLYDDALSDPRNFLKACYSHLGADPGEAERMDVAAMEDRVYPEVTIHGGVRSPLPDKVPAFLLPDLLKLYQDKIPALSHRLDRDLNRLWLTPYLQLEKSRHDP